MQLNADVDESDVARVRVGDTVTFTVDAYPSDTFAGTVSQVRVNPDIDQNVVSYTTVIDVANPSLTLRPGMTANVTIRTDTRQDVLRVPVNAVRFKPNDELFALLHQIVPRAARANSDPGSDPAAGSRSHAAEGVMTDHRQVWVLRNGRLQATPVRVGLSDGTYIEVLDGSLSAGDEVVLNAIGRT
jgi:HlyD family secretion protein